MQLSMMDRPPRRTRFGRKLPLACALVIGLLGGCPPMPVEGPEGPRGPAGPQGAVGPQGATGPAGTAGANGLQGLTGPQGGTGPQGPIGPQGPQGPIGAQGPQGIAGADGQLRIFGNGSAGDSIVAASVTFADTNLQYANFTVNAGVTLTIPSGTIIRCTGTFTNNGTIAVQTGAAGSLQRSQSGTGSVDGVHVPSEAGVALSPASPGEFGFDTFTRFGGEGGLGLPAFEARSELNPGAKAGGGGGGTYASRGNSGGGSLVVLAQTAILNAATGSITAPGAGVGTRRGGGAGGIIILASPGSVVNNGAISANGGNGGISDTFAGAGGGGGGGIIHMLSPTITAGTTSVLAGLAGTDGGAGSVSSNPRQGGGGGGACGGNGGSGSQVNTAGTPSGADPGLPGHVLQSTVNPTALF